MRIGVDIDDTITNSWECLIPYYSSRFNIPKEILSKSKPYYNAIKHLIPLEDYYKTILPIHDKHSNDITLKDEVKEVIDKLYALGHKIYFITARGTDYTDSYKLTKDYLDSHGIKYEKIYTAVGNKADICLKEKIDLFIDDSFKHCTSVKEKGIDVLMFNTYYNKEHTNFDRVNSWHEIYEYIKDR